ncbi:unnamed protein product [Miscanthus lutarioriparius]|uniref:Uncharacterized protein n=1 Tax=Miscanthus lutarioriparius TaxID=422564 RepID=A0A811RZM0_9POAL|nr:unnamed protein product [Miscanthus lutarioriparius]
MGLLAFLLLPRLSRFHSATAKCQQLVAPAPPNEVCPRLFLSVLQESRVIFTLQLVFGLIIGVMGSV